MTRRVLADACALVAWFADGGSGMSQAGRAAFEDEVLVSSVTVWELTRKAALGKLPPLPLKNGSFGAWLLAQGFVPHLLGWMDAEHANSLPPIHKDPVDRMLIAQALRADVAIVSEDRLFADYGAAVVW